MAYYGYDLVSRQSEQFADDGGRSDLDKKHMIKTNAVESVLEGQDALDLVSHDHPGEYVLDLERWSSLGDRAPGNPVGYGQDGAEVILSPHSSIRSRSESKKTCGARLAEGWPHSAARKPGDEVNVSLQT